MQYSIRCSVLYTVYPLTIRNMAGPAPQYAPENRDDDQDPAATGLRGPPVSTSKPHGTLSWFPESACLFPA